MNEDVPYFCGIFCYHVLPEVLSLRGKEAHRPQLVNQMTAQAASKDFFFFFFFDRGKLRFWAVMQTQHGPLVSDVSMGRCISQILSALRNQAKIEK